MRIVVAPAARMRRAAAGTACLLAGAALLVGCGGAAPVPVPVEPGQYADVRTDLAADVGLADASVWLGAEMVGAAAAQSPNPVMSPLSLQLALAVLREGATGEARAQLDAVLGGGDVDAAVAALRERLEAFEGDVAGIDQGEPPEKTLVHLADGVFVQDGFEVEAEFLERAATVHGAEIASVDFAGGTAKPVLDAWANEETGGLVPKAPFEPSRDTVVTLLNAVVFGARWQSPFWSEETSDEPFTTAAGDVVDVATMHGEVRSPYAAGDGWVAAELPYREGFGLRVVRHDGDPLDAEGWREVTTALGAAAPEGMTITMPSWESTVTLALEELLVGLGVHGIFTAGELDGICPGAAVSDVAQTATITVTEDGTVAAAVTQIAVAVSAAEPPTRELVLDSPFEYQVYDMSTGMVLFAGLVSDPSVT